MKRENHIQYGYKRFVLLLMALGLALILASCSGRPASEIYYENDRYGFSLPMPEKFSAAIDIKEEGGVIYFVSKEIQQMAPGQMMGVVGRIEAYSKRTHTIQSIDEISDMTGMKLLAESPSYYFGWAHATDVQLPADTPEPAKSYFRELEKQFEEVIEDFAISDAGSKPVEPVTPAEPEPFALMAGQRAIPLKSWDSETDLEAILGKPISEKQEVLNAGSDTYTGSTVRILEYDGLSIRLFSPKDNGKTFWIMAMDLTGTNLQTPQGIKVGSGLAELKAAYASLEAVPDGRTDADNRAYRIMEMEESKFMVFEVEKGQVKKIEMYVELP